MRKSRAQSVAVVGAGPAGLMAAEIAARGGARVTVYERMPSAGRKFLLAGRGGLNLTHSEPFERFINRYGAARDRLRSALDGLTPSDLRAWSADLGQPTFVGTSGRVFPESFKASPLLRAWLQRLDGLGVTLRPRHRWTGWTPDRSLAFQTPAGPVTAEGDAVILALGGASWPRLGSDGAWTAILAESGIAITPLAPSNCGFCVAWSELFKDRFAGEPLKGTAVSFDGETVRGEAVVTRAGIEGGAIYALSGRLREAIRASGAAVATIALRPDLEPVEIARRMAARPSKQSTSTFLRKAFRLAPVAVALLNEARHSHPDGLDLASPLNAVPLRLTGTAPLAGAISTAGGVVFDDLDQSFMLRRRPGVFVAGEMMDWEAPTGGYLLQACLATGAAAGRGALAWLGPSPREARPG